MDTLSYFFLLLTISFSMPVVLSNSPKCGDSIMCPIGTPCVNELNETISCTDNSFCDDETEVCTCGPGFKETSYNLCLVDHQNDCSVYACNEEAQLVCHRPTNSCQCALRGTHYSIPQGKCVAMAGTDCSKTFGCTDNAFCNNELDWKCYCGGGFSQTSQGRCLLGYDRICNSSVPEGDDEDYLYSCNSDAFLRCNGKCVCEDETNFIYDEEQEECVSLVGGQCDFKVTVDDVKILKCIEGSKCVDNGQYGICKCINGRNVDPESKTCSSNSNKQQSSYIFAFSWILLMYIYSMKYR